MFQPGEYKCKVVGQGFKRSGTGNPMIVLTVVPKARVDMQGVEHTIHEPVEKVINMAITPGTREFAMQRLRHAGFDGKSMAELQLVGRYVDCFCTHEEYKGRTRDKWELSIPIEKPRDLDAEAVSDLDSMFGDELTKEFTADRVERPRPSSAADDEDTPFYTPF